MSFDFQVIFWSILAMIGIVGTPLYVFWVMWKKSGEALKEKNHH